MKSSSSSTSSSSSSSSFLSLYNKKDKCMNVGKRIPPLLLSSLGLTTIFSFFLLYSPNSFKSFIIPYHPSPRNLPFINSQKEEENCDLFKGHWIPDFKGSLYTNSSCSTIPNSKNCFKNGRKDRDFLNWKWKPDQCHLPRFDAKAFLEIVRGKTMAFIGDSVARNHMESLLCLLSQEEMPVDAYKDKDDRNRVWLFPAHDFTFKILWTKFFVVGEERMINETSSSGIFDLYLDKIDDNWTRELHTLDYVVISNGHWFFRPIYLHQGSDVVACVYCNEPNITDGGVDYAVSMTLRAALKKINHCKKCKQMVTLLRTFSPSHFENGSWNTGGGCNRTTPMDEKEIDMAGRELKLRETQVKEVERARQKSRRGKRFETLDITRAMIMRPDGHPGEHWGNKWMKGYNDCVHWCLPGPIDFWNDMLLAVMRRL